MDRIEVDDLKIFPPSMVVLRGGAFVEMTSIEFALLAELARQSGQVAGREALSHCALGRGYSSWDRSLDNHVSHICKKLGPAADGRRRIVSVRGKGYLYRRFQPVEAEMQTRKPAARFEFAAGDPGDAELVQAHTTEVSR